MSFDYGAEAVKAVSMENPSVGPHPARIRSIIHLGIFAPTYRGELKKAAPYVAVIFELKGKKDIGEDGDPLTLDKDIPIREGNKANCAKFRKAVEVSGELPGFNEFIGQQVQVDAVAGKEIEDDGKPKYVNCGDITAVAEDYREFTPELTVKGVGHVIFEELTKEAILELHPIRHIAMVMMKGVAYAGSKAEGIINEIRKENPDFAVQEKKDKEPDKDMPAPPEDMDADAEY